MNNHPLELIEKLDNNLFNNITETRNLAFEEGEVSIKNKYLIAIALDASLRTVDGVKALTIQALKHGVTKKEIIETLRIVNHICGVSSVYPATVALNEILK